VLLRAGLVAFGECFQSVSGLGHPIRRHNGRWTDIPLRQHPPDDRGWDAEASCLFGIPFSHSDWPDSSNLPPKLAALGRRLDKSRLRHLLGPAGLLTPSRPGAFQAATPGAASRRLPFRSFTRFHRYLSVNGLCKSGKLRPAAQGLRKQFSAPSRPWTARSSRDNAGRLP
jgi:hypothetical protein